MMCAARESGLPDAIKGAGSASWAVRAAAGRRLAACAEVPAAADALRRLLLDPEDTAVTLETAIALLVRGTTAAVRLVARAVIDADDQQADWLYTAVHDVLCPPHERGPGVAASCRALADDPEATVRDGAVEILGWLEGAPDTPG